MLKYVDTRVVFAEIPDEITLAVNISNCPCKCEGCHSSYLAEDIGEVLIEKKIDELITRNRGISCIALMGGDSDYQELNRLAHYIREHWDIKIAWYSGRQELDKNIDLANFDYIKLGPYIKSFGPLNSKTTNQRFYTIVYDPVDEDYSMVDITHKFWK